MGQDNSVSVEDIKLIEANTPSSAGDQWCCMHHVLSLQDDFCAEKSLMQSIIKSAGHVCMFLSKFHCELNPIKMLWGYGKYRVHTYIFLACAQDCLILDLQNIRISPMGSLQLQRSSSHNASTLVILLQSASSSGRHGDILMLTGTVLMLLSYQCTSCLSLLIMFPEKDLTCVKLLSQIRNISHIRRWASQVILSLPWLKVPQCIHKHLFL